MESLIGKIIIKGSLIVQTGLAIGGNKSGIDIGSLDNPVIKIKKGNQDIPYIPGSSLKGKLRSLIAKAAGSENVASDKALIQDPDSKYKCLAVLFGFSADQSDQIGGEALLKVRDSFVSSNSAIDYNSITEEKTENTINRITGVANPRPIERVLPGTIFEIDLCLDVYNEIDAREQLELLDLGLELLNQDYLGGGGTRGNGRVITNLAISEFLKVDSKSRSLISDEFIFKFSNSKFNESKAN